MLRWSLRLGSLLGVPVYVHWTFVLLVGWLMAGPILKGGPGALADGLRTGGFVVAVFGCVLLHEMGHALAARLYAIRTRDIVLLPIGGVARLERLPERPWQELVVSVAGPLVNVAIAAIIVPGVLISSGTSAFAAPPDGQVSHAHFLASLGAVNIMLVAFNALPAFPMDGGRVLRALLAMAMPRPRATRIAARIGQGVAILLGAYALVNAEVMLALVALFVFTAASAETSAERARESLGATPVSRAMVTRFGTLRASQSLDDAVREMLATGQYVFPVLADVASAADDAASLVGTLAREDVMAALSHQSPDAPISGVMRPTCPTVGEQETLQGLLDRIEQEAGAAPPVIAVVRDDPAHTPARHIVGLLTPQALHEFLALRDASARRRHRG
jgi:Zn-dependent protease/CBS domain-containing protein